MTYFTSDKIQFSCNETFIRSMRNHYNNNRSYHQKTSSHIHGFYSACQELGAKIVKTSPYLHKITFNNQQIGSIRRMRPSITTLSAATLCKNKYKTLSYLKQFGNVCPNNRIFTPNEEGLYTALQFIMKMNAYPDIVVKPSRGQGGEGVTVGICDESEFVKAWSNAITHTRDHTDGIIVEERIYGCDFRVIVVDGKVDCACIRVPAYVIGNGTHTLEHLVTEKNHVRSKHPHHKKYPIPLTSKHPMNIVPKSDEIVFLSDISNIHQGGESFDITDFVPDSVKIVSEKACRSIDGLGSAGVDIIYNGERERTPKIIEINTSPNFGIHYYPMYGPQRNPAKSIVMRMINQTVPH